MLEESKEVIRLSEAFPPDSTNNSRYISDNHLILKEVDLSRVKTEDIVYR